MKKQILQGVVLVSALLLNASLFAAGEKAMPPGKWWRRPELAKQLQLTPEQQTRLDAVGRDAARVLIDLKAEVEKRELDLREELENDQLDRGRIQRAAAALNEARGRLFERELLLMVEMRGVLTTEQWTRIRGTLLDRRQMRREEGGPPGPPENRPMQRRPPRQ